MNRPIPLIPAALGLVTLATLPTVGQERPGSPASQAIERAFDGFWKADDPRDAARAAERLLKTGVDFETALVQQRAVASLAGLFGVIALVLAAIGLYGVTAYSVARRTSEIGVRMALGADRGRVMGLVLGGAFRRVAIGLALGLPLAVGAGYLLSAQLYGVTFWDPVALGVAAVALAVAALLASVVPATRAAALAPMSALRTD